MEARVPPHSIEAEQAVLGGLMLATDGFARIGPLSIADFYRLDHQQLFEALQSLNSHGKPIDAITVGEWLETHPGELDPNYPVMLANNTPGSANIHAYAEIVRKRSIERQAIQVATQLAETLYSREVEDSQQEIADAIAALMNNQVGDQKNSYHLKEAWKLAAMELERAVELAETNAVIGVPSGLADLDRHTGGFHKQEFTTIGARPAMGKTAFMLNIAMAAAEAGYKVGVVSTEQGAVQLAMRCMSQSARISLQEMRTGKYRDPDALGKLYGQRPTALANSGYWIWDRPSPDISEVRAQAQLWKQRHDIDILLVDYIQRMKAKGYSSRTYEIGEVARGLKEIARDCDIPVVALAQLKREVEDRTLRDPQYTPIMSDLKDSGEIEQESDCVMTLHRPGVLVDGIDPSLAKITICKARSGPTGQAVTNFVGEYVSFENRARFGEAA